MWRERIRGAEARSVILAFCLFVLGTAAVFEPPSRVDGSLRLGGIPLPALCVMRNAFGTPCPGCGLTRSVVAGVHGDFEASWSAHRLGGAVLGYVVVQVGFSLLWLAAPGWRRGLAPLARVVDGGVLALAVLLGLNWVFGTLPAALAG